MRIARTWLFALASALLPGFAAGRVTVARDGSGRVVMSAPSCTELEREVAAVRDWMRHLDEPLSGFPAQLPNAADGSCSAVLDGSLSPRVRSLEGTYCAKNMSNCHDTSLVSSEILPSLQFVAGRTMSFWTSSPLCRPLGPAEPPAAGDLIVIRWRIPSLIEAHSMVYVSDSLAFSKHSTDSTWPYALQSIQGELDSYGLQASAPASCLRAQGTPASCSSFANYYRCQTYGQFVASHSGALPEGYTEAKMNLDEIGVEIEPLACTTKVPDAGSLASLADRAQALIDLSKLKLAVFPEVRLGLIPSHAAGTDAARELSIFFWESVWWTASDLELSANLLRLQ